MDYIALIKRVFKENFLRDLSDAEAGEFVDKMISQSREDLSKIDGFTEERFQEYLSKNLVLAFSPNAINAEIFKIVKEIGIEELEASSRYKRLAEMSSASCLALALRKILGQTWMIKAQDAPDIILVKKSSREFSDKPFDAIMLEIMEIPEHARQELGEDIEVGIANFIRTKKFNKRYEGIPHLLVHINLNQQNLNLNRVSSTLQAFSDNPFHNIWSRANADPSSHVMDISLLTPEFIQTQFDFAQDRELMF
jgi:hypothetical protein